MYYLNERESDLEVCGLPNSLECQQFRQQYSH